MSTDINYFTDREIEENKETFIGLVKSIQRPGHIDKLLTKLEESDFYTAPASTKYHAAYKGGLVDHSLNVYYNLCSLIKNKHIEDYDEDTIKIVALFHDISKMNYYESYFMNKKVYKDNGTKSDNVGRFDWESIEAYKTKDAEERFVLGNHAENSAFMINKYFSLSAEEYSAILNHMGSCDNHMFYGDNYATAFGRYKLAALLHVADMISTFVDEAR